MISLIRQETLCTTALQNNTIKLTLPARARAAVSSSFDKHALRDFRGLLRIYTGHGIVKQLARNGNTAEIALIETPLCHCTITHLKLLCRGASSRPATSLLTRYTAVARLFGMPHNGIPNQAHHHAGLQTIFSTTQAALHNPRQNSRQHTTCKCKRQANGMREGNTVCTKAASRARKHQLTNSFTYTIQQPHHISISL